MASLGRRVDEDTLHSSTLAEMLTANLTALNVLLEGTAEEPHCVCVLLCINLHMDDDLSEIGRAHV